MPSLLPISFCAVTTPALKLVSELNYCTGSSLLICMFPIKAREIARLLFTGLIFLLTDQSRPRLGVAGQFSQSWAAEAGLRDQCNSQLHSVRQA